MPRPYSEDLREKVLKVFDEGKMKIKKICEMLNIDEKTLYWWRKRREETGSVKAASGYQNGHSHKIKNINEFSKFMEENHDVTIDRIIEKFGNMCKKTAYNYLKKVRYTHKKNLS